MKIWTPLEDYYVYVCRQDEDEIGCSLARWRADAESQHKIHLWDQEEEEEPDGVRPLWPPLMVG